MDVTQQPLLGLSPSILDTLVWWHSIKLQRLNSLPVSASIGLTHWGWVTNICISKLTIIGSDYGLAPTRCQAIIWTNAGILFIWPLGTNFNEILNKIQKFSFKKIHFKMSGKWQPSCLGHNVLVSHDEQLAQSAWNCLSGNKPLPESMLTQTYSFYTLIKYINAFP